MTILRATLTTLLLSAALAGCAYLEDRAACNDACEELFSPSGCDVSTEDAGVGEGTATFACTQTCADETVEKREAFLSCVGDSTCDEILDGTCDFDELTGRSAP